MRDVLKSKTVEQHQLAEQRGAWTSEGRTQQSQASSDRTEQSRKLRDLRCEHHAPDVILCAAIIHRQFSYSLVDRTSTTASGPASPARPCGEIRRGQHASS